MKKLVFGLIAVFMTSFVATAQNDYKLEDYKSSKIIPTTVENELFKEFLGLNKWFNVDDVENEIHYHKLINENESIFVCKLKDSKKYDYSYVSYNSLNKTFFVSFVKKEADKRILISSQNETLLYSINNNQGNVVLTNEVVNKASRTCFQYCMDYVEERITDDFIGYVAWNTNPALQIVAAYGCHRTCKGILPGQ